MTPLSAFASGVGSKRFVLPIDSVWRFGRDFRHSTNRAEMLVYSMKYTVMNLHRTRISPKPRITRCLEVLHAGSHRSVRVQSIRDGVEVPHKGLLWTPPGKRDGFPYPWQKPQPHRPARHAQWSQRLGHLTMEITDPLIRKTPTCMVSGKPWIWGDTREDVKNKFIREFENCKNGTE